MASQEVARLRMELASIKNMVKYLWANRGDEEPKKAPVDFIVDNFDRADSDTLGDYWGAGYGIRGATCISKIGTTTYARKSVISRTTGYWVVNSYWSRPAASTFVAHLLSATATISNTVAGVVSTISNSTLNTSDLSTLLEAAVSPHPYLDDYREISAHVRTFVPRYPAAGVKYLRPVSRSDYTLKVTFRHTGEVKETYDDDLGLQQSNIRRDKHRTYKTSVQTPIGVLLRGEEVEGVLVGGVFCTAFASTFAEIPVMATSLHVEAQGSSRLSFTVPLGDPPVEVLTTYASTGASLQDSVNTFIGYPSESVLSYSHGLLSGANLSGATINAEVAGPTKDVTTDTTPTVLGQDGTTLIESSLPSAGITSSVDTTFTSSAADTVGLPEAVIGLNTLLVSISGDTVTTLLNGAEIDRYTQSVILSGTVVGLAVVGNHLEEQLATLDLVDGYSGITQFKAWVGDVEPDGSESGHGDIGAGGVLDYKDGYHSTDAAGVVTYHPSALD